MIKDLPIEYAPGAEIGLDVPPEPRGLSVVVDHHGVAFQRLGTKWWRAGAPFFEFGTPEAKALSFSWRALLVYRGPVRLVYTPSAEEAR